MMEIEKKIDLLASLRVIQDTPVESLHSGICNELCLAHFQSYDARRYILKFYETWPSYSGCPVYPVPCPDGGIPDFAYARAPGLPDNFRWIGPYGDLRKSLLVHIITELEKELQNDN